MFLGKLHWGDDLKKQIFGPIISDPGTLYVQDNTDALAQAWDEGFEAGEQAGLMPSMHGDARNPYREVTE